MDIKCATLYNSHVRVRVRTQAQTNYDYRKTPHPPRKKHPEAFKKTQGRLI